MTTTDRTELPEPKPFRYARGWQHPESNGSLLCETAKWPKNNKCPRGWKYSNAYQDRIFRWDRDDVSGFDRYDAAAEAAGFTGHYIPHDAKDEQLIALVETLWPEYDVRAVRVIHYHGTNGYDTPLIEWIYKEKP